MRQAKKKKTIIFPKNQKGLTIIGLLIAIAIISLSLTTGLGLITRNLRLASITAHEITAAALAQEGVELVRNIRDTGDNWCLKQTPPVTPLNGFDRINKPNLLPKQAYAIDNNINTYVNNFNITPLQFNNARAGLCPDVAPNTGNFITCAINSPNRQFIRKIQILNASYGDGQALDPDITYPCQTINGAVGVLAVVTVYWSEFWENNWPNTADHNDLWLENNKTLHRVRVIKCFYDWRPE